QAAAGMPGLTFDAEALHRAVLNVVTNAIDACERPAASNNSPASGGRQPADGAAIECDDERAPRRGLIEVSTNYSAPEALARIIVEDNGSGISPENLEKIFTLFMSTKQSRGTGLGLPVSQKIMQEHGGRILVESQPGQGSRFILELPAVMPELKDAGA